MHVYFLHKTHQYTGPVYVLYLMQLMQNFKIQATNARFLILQSQSACSLLILTHAPIHNDVKNNQFNRNVSILMYTSLREMYVMSIHI